MNDFKAQYVAPALRWFHGLQPREQRALRALCVFLSAALLWQGVWVPVRDVRDRNQALYLSALGDLEWMHAHAEDAKQKPEAVENEGPVLALVAASAQRQGIVMQQAEPSQDGSLRVTLDQVPFTRLIAWLELLQAEHGIRTDQAALERAATPGQVSASLTLRR